VVSTVTRLAPYRDENGNEIVYAGPPVEAGVNILFTGANNRVVVADVVRLAGLRVDFNCDNGLLEIGRSRGVPAFSAAIRIGQDCTVRIGKNVSSTSTVAMSTAEGTAITIGDDVMFASENQVRADDGHPIFDVRTGKRVNVSTSISIGDHVWLGRFATVLAGADIGDGSVIGYGGIVTGRIPNNCVAVGSPAKVVRHDVAWERPHLTLVKPFYKPNASSIQRSPYWSLTADDEPATTPQPSRRRGAARSVRRSVRARWSRLLGAVRAR
jgi:acetyltransferase-like isoleucine patch superfamily enzyme